MIARVHHDPLRPEPRININVAFKIGVNGIGDVGRVFRDVHRRQRMQAERHAVALGEPPHIVRALMIEGGNGVGGRVELDVDEADSVRGCPRDALFELDVTAEIDADAIAQLQRGGGLRTHQSCGTPAAFTTLPHFAVSARKYAPSSAAVVVHGSRPCASNFCLMSSLANAWRVTALTFAMMAGDVAAGMNSAYHVL